MLKIVVLISGGGSNLESIMDKIDSGYLNNVLITKVIADREAKGLLKAKNRGYKTKLIDRKIYLNTLDSEILKEIDDETDYIVLAGFLSIIGSELINKFKNRIINIHPSLIPSFCGAGMYGLKVHKAAIDKGVKYSGCTVHFVDEVIDGGLIIDQAIVEVDRFDTAKILQEKILEKEHEILPKVLKILSEKSVSVINGKINIREVGE